MKIVVMSDSHGRNDRVEQIIKDNPDAFYFYHLGDVCDDPRNFPDVTFVRGNNDYFNIPESLKVDFGDYVFLLTHSHKIYGWGNEKKKQMAHMAKDRGCNIVLYGHTHTVDDCVIDGVRLLNPGSLYYNRDDTEIGYFVLEIQGNSLKVSRKTL